MSENSLIRIMRTKLMNISLKYLCRFNTIFFTDLDELIKERIRGLVDFTFYDQKGGNTNTVDTLLIPLSLKFLRFWRS